MGRKHKGEQRTGRFTGRAGLVGTDSASGPLWCRFCGSRVRSRLGVVCSNRVCQRMAAADL